MDQEDYWVNTHYTKMFEKYRLTIPRSLVYNIMVDVNAEGLKERGGMGILWGYQNILRKLGFQ